MEPNRLLILDFGSQYSHLIVRRCREIGIYSELLRCDTPLQTIERFGMSGVILSGGPSSVYDKNAPHVPEGFWTFVQQAKLPVLGICYGMQEMQYALGGNVQPSAHREYGYARLNVLSSQATGDKDTLFFAVPDDTKVWMSHGDSVMRLAPGFEVIGVSENSPYAAIVDRSRQLWGVQFHPEVTHTAYGEQVFINFAEKICRMNLGSWNMKIFAELERSKLNKQIGHRHVIGALSGGVDSTVAAALLHSIIGDRFHGFMVDTGLLRKNEGPEVVEKLRK